MERRRFTGWSGMGGAEGKAASIPAAGTAVSAQGFRPDIEGLRGIAVICVLLFHFRTPGFNGGFAGVDVFFVISGYLMTLIITQGLESGRFSLVQFYVKRLTRVAPALLALCLFLMVYGYFTLPPSDYSRLGSQTAASASFLSNFLFWMQSSYFDPAAEEKLLLNTWSLGVEFQFYVIYPLLLIAARRLLPKVSLFAVIFGIAALSFVLANIQAAVDPISGFFLLPARMWELLAGGLVVFARPPAGSATRTILAVTGVALIIASGFVFDANSPWPGWRTLIPVAGAVAIVWANSRSALVDNVLLRTTGRWSYSIYLWHWPIACFLFLGDQPPGAADIAAAAGGAIAAGALSYLLIERSRFVLSRAPAVAGPGLVVALGVVAVAGALLWQSDGAALRVSPAARLADAGFHDMSDKVDRCFSYREQLMPQCRFGNPVGDPSLILIGDSHSAAILDSLVESVETTGGSVLYAGASGCPTLVDTRASNRDAICEPFKRAYLDPLLTGSQRGVPVLIANYWYLGLDSMRTHYIGPDGKPEPISINGWRQRLTRTVCAISRNHPTYLMLPLPQYSTSVPRSLTRKIMAGDEQAVVGQALSQYLAEREPLVEGMRQAAQTCNAQLIDPLPAFCDKGVCAASDGQRPLYYDSNHPSLFGSQRLIPLFSQTFGRPTLVSPVR